MCVLGLHNVWVRWKVFVCMGVHLSGCMCEYVYVCVCVFVSVCVLCVCFVCVIVGGLFLFSTWCLFLADYRKCGFQRNLCCARLVWLQFQKYLKFKSIKVVHKSLCNKQGTWNPPFPPQLFIVCWIQLYIFRIIHSFRSNFICFIS